jgi:predicted transcriptional regulator
MSDTLVIKVDSALAERLRSAAEEGGETVETFARRVLEDTAADIEGIGDDEELRSRVSAFRASGASAPAGEVHAWLRSISTPSPLPRPKPRKPE